MLLRHTCAPACALLLGAAGCGPGPFTRAASSYASANNASTESLSTAPKTAFRICRKKAHVAYLQVRLGLMSTPEPIPWNTWYATAKATEKQSWEQYCREIESTGKVFSMAVGSLRQYGSALKSLAEGSKYDGADFQSAAEQAGKIATTLESPGVAAAMKPVGTLLGRFAGFLLQDVTEDRIEDYVRRADPIVQPIVEGLEKYVESVEGELQLTENAQRQALRALEARSELAGPLPGDPLKLVMFYGFALETEEDMQETRAILDGYRSVLRRLRAAHGLLVKAGGAQQEDDIKKAIGSIFELVTQLQSLNSALAKKE